MLEAAILTKKQKLRVILASPRGFCAGVVRALDTVDAMLERYGPPLYVHHDIVHNQHVLEALEKRGVIFVEAVEDVPHGAHLVISAHGASARVFAEGRQRRLHVVDGTCPLVTKVHHEVVHQSRRHGRHVLLIGHRGHAETIGTMGQIAGPITIIESIADALRFESERDVAYACAMQTTLSVRDTEAILEVLRARIPDLAEPAHSDICYATTNRQEAVAAIAPRCDAFVIVGGSNSSNSQRLVDIAEQSGCERTFFVSRGALIDPSLFVDVDVLGISSGASTPEPLVEELCDRLSHQFDLTIEEVSITTENQHYKLPSITQPRPT
jgi:4-hydroxy-3-methylbut-2-enyl diphosphate reductase